MKKIIFTLGLGLLTSSVMAKSINSHLFRFGDTLESVSVEDALSPSSENQNYRLIFRAAYDYAQDTLIGIDASRNNQILTVVDNIHTATFGLTYLVTPWLSLALDVPYHRVELSSQYRGSDLTKWTLGDMRARAKLRITPSSSPVHFAVMPYFAAPTGRGDYFVSDDSYAFGGALLGDWRVFSRLKLFGNAGYTYARNAHFLNIDRSKRIELGGGVIVKIFKWLDVTAESISALTLPGYEQDQNPLEIRAGLRGTFGSVRGFAGGGLEGFRAARSNDTAVYGGVKIPLLAVTQPTPTPIPTPIPTPVPTPTPTPTPVPTPILDVKVLEEKLSLSRNIKFESDQAIITPLSLPLLDSAVAEILKYGSQIQQITIEGHTDSIGAANYNEKLSQDRADAVKAYLVTKGVPANKLEAIGYGESQPQVKETNARTRAINRRVEFKVNQTFKRTVKTVRPPA